MAGTNRVAVAVIHGMGSQGENRPDPDTLRFSAGLYRELKRHMGLADFDAQIAWREVFGPTFCRVGRKTTSGMP